MRASRLLRILLALQNRGRLTSLQLATELEVTRRTIMRDIDALTEAGLPIIVYRGNAGGVELGFNYRSRLLGLNGEEAEALGLLLACPHPALNQMQVASAINAARDKLIESLPELVRNRIQLAQRRFKLSGGVPAAIDPRVPALAQAIRDGAVVRIKAKSRAPRTVHPVALQLAPDGWSLIDARDSQRPIRDVEVGDINISARRFAAGPSAGG